ncbi:MAG: hypothetical protein ABIY55_31355 [Kofleriaceae bacterium]
MERLLGSSGGLVVGIAAAVGYAFFALIVITLDRFRATSASKDDTQVELKILLYALSLMGLFVAADGVAGLLSAIAGGFKGGGDAIKVVLPPIVVGVGVLAGIAFLFLPRTNAQTVRTAEALALFTVGLYFGVTAISNAYVFVTSVVLSGPWATSSDALAHVVVDGAIGVVGLTRLGALSGWTIPVRPVAPPPQYPPQGGGYPPQGGGYPPPGGGYPPQGGGYPPQGGGGYPPPGGGYPPPGGGGYPPQGGGGYPPR